MLIFRSPTNMSTNNFMVFVVWEIFLFFISINFNFTLTLSIHIPLFWMVIITQQKFTIKYPVFLYFSLVERDLESIVKMMLILFIENIQLENKQNPFRYFFEIIVIIVSAIELHKNLSEIILELDYIYIFITKLFLY